MNSIDLNCDLGEGFGVYRLAEEERIFPWITSANIACGFHAGDPVIMQRSVSLAVRNGISIGAHPGTPDLEGFGRRRLEMSPGELECAVIYQLGALEGICRALGSSVVHVKPHGWIYNEASHNEEMARSIVSAVSKFSPRLILFAPPSSVLIRTAREYGVSCAQEGFMDRRYLEDGRLVPRNEARALITEPGEAAEQALRLALDGKVRTVDGVDISVPADTLCIHGDNPQVLAILAQVRDTLGKHGVQIQPFKAAR